jgi:hypothetical protein
MTMQWSEFVKKLGPDTLSFVFPQNAGGNIGIIDLPNVVFKFGDLVIPGEALANLLGLTGEGTNSHNPEDAPGGRLT